MFEVNFRYIRARELDRLLGISRSKRESMVRNGELPKPYRLGKRMVAWRSDELEVAIQGFERLEEAYQQIKMVRTR